MATAETLTTPLPVWTTRRTGAWCAARSSRPPPGRPSSGTTSSSTAWPRPWSSREVLPGNDPFTGTLLAFSTYFVGFVARPFGAALFGHYGDRIGRKTALIATLVLMGGATMGIGLVPGYESIGIWGAVLLTFFRVVQGIGVGGEWGGAVLMAGEWTDPKRRGFTTSFAQLGAPAGMVLANGASSVMSLVTSEEDFLTGAGASRSC